MRMKTGIAAFLAGLAALGAVLPRGVKSGWSE